MCLDDGHSPERVCMVMGPVDGANRAARTIQDLIDKNMDRVGCHACCHGDRLVL